MEVTKSTVIGEIEKLCRKADQCRSIHNMIKDRMVLFNRVVLLYVTIGSAISSMLIFAALTPFYQLFVGIFSASIFVVSVIPAALNLDLKILENRSAIQIWGEWIRDAKNFCSVEADQLDADGLLNKQKDLLSSYKRAMDNTPLIPDKKFNKFKRLHLQKVEISKALDKNPFKTIREIKRELRNTK